MKCPPGYELLADVEQNMQDATGIRAQAQAGESYGGADPAKTCVTAKHPEPAIEHGIRRKQLTMIRSAPFAQPVPAAFSSAVVQRQQMANVSVANTEGAWAPRGKGPLISDHPSYGSVNGLGLANLMGRIDSLTYDPTTKRLFSLKGTGGVWMSTDVGTSWRSIGDSLPSQIVGAVAYSLYPNNGNLGTVVTVSGDATFGGNGYTGYGAFYSRDLGQTWHKAQGVPDGALGFEIEVDRTRPNVVYAATQFGLYRSVDGGVSYTNVRLPTGPCAGVEGTGDPTNKTSPRPECQLANVVTDVVVRPAGGVNANFAAGTVVAAVGWRGGNRRNVNTNTPQSPQNGIYRSTITSTNNDPGKPGTFTKIAPIETPVTTQNVSPDGFAPQAEIGRVEFGRVIGSAQDKDYLYAIVQDAQALNGCVDFIDPVCVSDPVPGGTNLDGIYVSSDFGDNWRLMGDQNTIARDTGSGSYLIGVGTALGFEPGVQAWYNLWIMPDPTRQTAAGVPTRLLFGMEEVWEDDDLRNPPGHAMNGPTFFKVIGLYFRGTSCQLLQLGIPACPPRDFSTNTPRYTTHPDQHDGIFVPDGKGGVTAVLGNDGGFYKQTVNAGQEFNNDRWGRGNQRGFNTLLPYDVAVAKDGTLWAGLQDNGHIKITPANSSAGDQAQYMTFGGDGTFAEVDPNNSLTAYEATPFNAMRVSIDGGKTWRSIDPATTADRFINPFEMDHIATTAQDLSRQQAAAKHLVTAGNEVVETTFGAETAAGKTAASATPPPANETNKQWRTVFDLGTQDRPGDASASPSSTDPVNSMSAIDVHGDAVYVGYCGVCDVLNQSEPFKSGIATNVGGSQAPMRMTTRGWHIIRNPVGLPERYITSIYIDPRDASKRTIYVAMGGYSRRWVPPNTLQDDNAAVGEGNLFRSTDGGNTFTNVSGNLPDVPATWVTLRAGQILVGTDIGVFATSLTPSLPNPTFRPLGPRPGSPGGLPVIPIATMNLHPANPNILVAATYGRGIWRYAFTGQQLPVPPPLVVTPTERPPTPTSFTNIASYNFDAGDQGWAAVPGTSTVVSEGGASAPGPPMTWRRGTDGSAGHTPPNSFTVSPQLTPQPAEQYYNETTTSLTSPAFSNAGGWVFVDFKHKRNTEPGFDYMNVDWSADAGVNWNPVLWVKEGANWSSTKTFDGLNPNYPNHTAESVAFKAPTGVAGQVFKIRFRFTSDQLVSFPPFTGASVDDVVIKR